MTAKVVITGMGAVSALGIGVEALWSAARDGRTGVRSIAFPRGKKQYIKTAAHMMDFNPEPSADRRNVARQDRFSAMALVAADEACRQAGIEPGSLNDRCGVIIGSGIGGATTMDDNSYAYYVTNDRLDPMTVPKVMPSMAASQLSMRYKATGPSFCISSACSSASQAIGTALLLIRSGLIDCALVGGAEALLSPGGFRAWEALRVMTPTLCRPFSAGRDGMVLGEGAAVLVIESIDHARRRGATPIAELAGYGTTSDADDLLRPNAASACRAMTLAIADAGVEPADIGYVNAHGTATVLNDVAEARALSMAFGAMLSGIPVSSTKPVHGHALGAAGGLELVVAVKALNEQVAPPTINWTGADPQCMLDVVPNHARAIRCDVVMSNSFAFGGINAALIARRFVQ